MLKRPFNWEEESRESYHLAVLNNNKASVCFLEKSVFFLSSLISQLIHSLVFSFDSPRNPFEFPSFLIVLITGFKTEKRGFTIICSINLEGLFWSDSGGEKKTLLFVLSHLDAPSLSS